MKKIYNTIFLLLLISTALMAQVDKSVGVGLTRWHKTDFKQEIASVQVDYTISLNRDYQLFIPFISHGRFVDKTVIYKEGTELNRGYLWEAGFSTLQEISKVSCAGARFGE